MRYLAIYICLLAGVCMAAEPRNALRNGSFEAGWCHEIGRVTLYHDAVVPDASWLTDDDAYDGTTSLRLPDLAGSRYFSVPVVLEKGRFYTISLQAKALDQATDVTLSASRPATRTKTSIDRNPITGSHASARVTRQEWTRLSIEVAGSEVPMFVEFSGANVLIDSIQIMPNADDPRAVDSTLEADPTDDLMLEDPADVRTAFVPAATVECGIVDSSIGRIHDGDTAVSLPVQCYNHGQDTQQATLHYTLQNHLAATVATGTLAIGEVAPGKARKKPLDLGRLPHGKYALTYWLDGSRAAGGVITFDVIPPLPEGRVAPIGLLTDLNPQMIALMQRAGLVHYASLTDHAVSMETRYDFATRTVPDHSALFAEGAAAGLIMSNHILPSKWPRKAAWSHGAWLPARHPDPGPEEESYYDAVEKYVQIYAPHFKVWWICDEAEGHYHPHQLLPILKRTSAIIKKYRPDAEIMVSATAPWWDQFARIGGMEYVDWMGGSVMGMSGDHGRKLNHLSRVYDKKVWPTAGAFTMERQFSPGHGGEIHANWRLHHALITSVFLHRATASSMYRAMPGAYDWTMVHDPYNVLAPDNTMTSALSLYTIVGRFLAGVVPDESPLPVADSIWPYTTADGVAGLCVFPAAPAYTIDLPAEKRQYFDQLGNPTDEPPPAGAFAFIHGVGITAAELHAALRVVPRETGEAPEPTAVPVADGDTVAIQITDAGTTQRVAPPTPYTERFPWGGVATDGGRVWLHTARRTTNAPTIDGALAEWHSVSSSSLHYNLWTLNSLDHGPIQGESASHLIASDHGMDFRVDWSAAYDDTQLYLKAQVLDDHLMAGDKLVVTLWQQDAVRTVTILPVGDTVTVHLDDAVLTVPAACRLIRDPAIRDAWAPWPHPSDVAGYTLEIALPWKALGITPAAGQILGFDVYGYDTDSPTETSVLRWAGKAPRGYLRLGTTPIPLEARP